MRRLHGEYADQRKPDGKLEDPKTSRSNLLSIQTKQSIDSDYYTLTIQTILVVLDIFVSHS